MKDKTDGRLVCKWMEELRPVPPFVEDFSECGCERTGCKSNSCKCKKRKVFCTDACRCKNCENKEEHDNDDDDDDVTPGGDEQTDSEADD